MGLGINSGTQLSICEAKTFSKTVRIEGKHALRHGDTCYMNNRNTTGKVCYVKDVKTYQPTLPYQNPPQKGESDNTANRAQPDSHFLSDEAQQALASGEQVMTDAMPESPIANADYAQVRPMTIPALRANPAMRPPSSFPSRTPRPANNDNYLSPPRSTGPTGGRGARPRPEVNSSQSGQNVNRYFINPQNMHESGKPNNGQTEITLEILDLRFWKSAPAEIWDGYRKLSSLPIFNGDVISTAYENLWAPYPYQRIISHYNNWNNRTSWRDETGTIILREDTAEIQKLYATRLKLI